MSPAVIIPKPFRNHLCIRQRIFRYTVNAKIKSDTVNAFSAGRCGCTISAHFSKTSISVIS